MGSPNRLGACLRQSKMLHLAFLDQVLDGSSNIFNGNPVIHAMLVEQVDDIGLQALQRSSGNLLDVFGTAVQPRLLGIFDVESELRRDHDIFAKWREGFADKFFVRERAVDFSGIEERYATVDCRANQCDSSLLVHRSAVALAQAHAAEPDGRNFKIAFSEFSFLHCCNLRMLLVAFPNDFPALVRVC